MAKKSNVVKVLKRQQMVAKYALKRKELKEKGDYAALQNCPATLPRPGFIIAVRSAAGQEVISVNLAFHALFSELAHKGKFLV